MKIFFKRLNILDKNGKYFYSVIVLDKFGKKDKKLSITQMREDNIPIYKFFVNNKGLIGNKQYLKFSDFKKSYIKLKTQNQENRNIKFKLKRKLFYDDTTMEEKIKFINKRYIEILNNRELFLNIQFDEELLTQLNKKFIDIPFENFNKIQNHFLFSTIYGTTKMEDSKLTESKAEKIFIGKEGSKDFITKEFQNLKNAFKKLNSINHLTIDEIRLFHAKATKNLDLLKPLDELEFKPGEFRIEPVRMLGKYLTPQFENMGKLIGEIIKNTKSINGLGSIIYFHLLFYLLHPFYNGNKRTTRIFEYYFTKINFPEYYGKFLGMGYYYYLDKVKYFHLIENILVSNYKNEAIIEFIHYYKNSFEEMIKISIKEISILELKEKFGKGNLINLEIYEFLLRQKFFNTKDLRLHLMGKIFEKFKVSSNGKVNLILEKEFKKDLILIEDKDQLKEFQSKIYIGN